MTTKKDKGSLARLVERLPGFKKGPVKLGAQPEYALPLDESVELPDLTPILGGFATEFIKSLSRTEIATVLSLLLAFPIVCRSCGMQLYWGTASIEIDREKNPILAPYEYFYCIPCESYYPMNEAPFILKHFWRHKPDLTLIREGILDSRPKELEE